MEHDLDEKEYKDDFEKSDLKFFADYEKKKKAEERKRSYIKETKKELTDPEEIMKEFEKFKEERARMQERDRYYVDVTLKCYMPCVIAPGPRLTTREQNCIANCTRKFLLFTELAEQLSEEMLMKTPIRLSPPSAPVVRRNVGKWEREYIEENPIVSPSIATFGEEENREDTEN